MTPKGLDKAVQPIVVIIKIVYVFFSGKKRKYQGPFGFRTV
jgi:hypothetical protein